MAQTVHLPKLGANMESGVVLRWLKAPGDAVRKGEPLVEVETDKAVQEVVAPADGRLLHILAAAGTQVAVGGELGIIGTEGEPVGPAAVPDAAAAPLPAPNAGTAADPAAPGPAFRPGGQEPVMPWAPASPAARRRARELGVSLDGVKGTGPGGRITVADVEAAATTAAAAPPAAPPAPPAPAPPGAVVEPLSRLRAQIARRMARSAREIPQFTVSRRVDVTRILEIKSTLGSLSGSDGPLRLSVTDFLIQGVARALRDFRDLNATFAGDPESPSAGLIRHPHVHIGLATDTPRGLLVPVVREADTLSLVAIARIRRGLIERAQAGRLQAGDLEGSTFTISNLGPFGVDSFTALVNPPEVGILAVGRVQPDPGSGGARHGVHLTVSADHRAVDGAYVARFLGWLAEWCAAPDRWEVA